MVNMTFNADNFNQRVVHLLHIKQGFKNPKEFPADNKLVNPVKNVQLTQAINCFWIFPFSLQLKNDLIIRPQM